MTQTVLKPFTTRLQRFGAGDTIPPRSDLAPHTAESLAARGFISDDAATPKSPAPRRGPKS